MTTDIINSSESLEWFIQRENLESPLVRLELDSGRRFNQSIDRIINEIESGSRELTFDLQRIPIDVHPGRRIGVQLFTVIENRKRELKGEDLLFDSQRLLSSSSSTYFIPNNPSILQQYYSHIESWEKKIESNDDSIYSDWSGFTGSFGDRVFGDYVTSLYTTRYMKDVQFREFSFHSELSEYLRSSNENRRMAMIHLLRSYRCLVEESPDLVVYQGRLKTTIKTVVVSMMEDISRKGYNPFDLMFIESTDEYKRNSNSKTRKWFWLTLFIQLIGLTLIVYTCVRDKP
jgi:hypothetical protein